MEFEEWLSKASGIKLMSMLRQVEIISVGIF